MDFAKFGHFGTFSGVAKWPFIIYYINVDKLT